MLILPYFQHGGEGVATVIFGVSANCYCRNLYPDFNK